MARAGHAFEWKEHAAAHQGVTLTLARFIAALKSDDIPESTQSVVIKALIDGIGCGLYGLLTPWASLIHEFALEQGGPAEASLWAADGRKVSPMNAALAAGTAIHSFELDDHCRAKTHPGAPIIPAALALGESRGVSGRTLLTAIAAGYETMIRVCLAANPGVVRMRGWHTTGTGGTLGAAAAASVILGLDADTTASALGLAGTQSAGLYAFSADGAMSKRLHPGRAAQAGVMAALLAARGFHGPRYVLEAEDGGFFGAFSDAPDIAEVTEGLGRQWRTDEVCFKPYACCGSNHSAIDATLRILSEQKLQASDVDHVVTGVSRIVDTQTGYVYRPTTALNAQMSQRYNIAVAMLDKQAYVEQFTDERIKAHDVCELAGKVKVEIDQEMDAVYPKLYAGKVTIVTRDGRRFTQRVDYSKGMPENPMDKADIERKFLSLAGAAVGRETAAGLLSGINAALGGGSIAPLAQALGACRLVRA